MLAFRIASSHFPIFDGTGALLRGARWNSAGRAAIYCADSLAACQLELLVHIGRVTLPRNHVWIAVDVPDDAAAEVPSRADLPAGWDHPTRLDVAQAVGDRWLAANATAVLRVPSVAAPNDRVVAINPRHADFGRITASAPRPMVWDPRLFGTR
jgi:RES domain-containing protein